MTFPRNGSSACGVGLAQWTSAVATVSLQRHRCRSTPRRMLRGRSSVGPQIFGDPVAWPRRTGGHRLPSVEGRRDDARWPVARRTVPDDIERVLPRLVDRRMRVMRWALEEDCVKETIEPAPPLQKIRGDLGDTPDPRRACGPSLALFEMAAAGRVWERSHPWSPARPPPGLESLGYACAGSLASRELVSGWASASFPCSCVGVLCASFEERAASSIVSSRAKINAGILRSEMMV